MRRLADEADVIIRHIDLPMPSIFFGAIAAAVFVLLGVITWSYRDVANRHDHKVGGAAGHGAGH